MFGRAFRAYDRSQLLTSSDTRCCSLSSSCFSVRVPLELFSLFLAAGREILSRFSNASLVPDSSCLDRSVTPLVDEIIKRGAMRKSFRNEFARRRVSGSAGLLKE